MRINPTKKIITRQKVTNVSIVLETLKADSLYNTIANSDYECVLKRDWVGDYSEKSKKAGR